ncbi:MAG: hypothetical protein AAF739_12320 [Pseudomonadota bacterium]
MLRLDRIRQLEECRDLVMQLDRMGLLQDVEEMANHDYREDFETFKPLFDQVEDELVRGLRIMRRIKMIRPAARSAFCTARPFDGLSLSTATCCTRLASPVARSKGGLPTPGMIRLFF